MKIKKRKCHVGNNKSIEKTTQHETIGAFCYIYFTVKYEEMHETKNNKANEERIGIENVLCKIIKEG